MRRRGFYFIISLASTLSCLDCFGLTVESVPSNSTVEGRDMVAVIWVIEANETLTERQKIRDFNIAKREEDIGYYAGFVGSAFMFGRALTSFLWGVIADRYGRKPVIVFGIVAVVIFNTLFGLSSNFWMALSMRFLLGSLCGLLGPMRAYASEVCRVEYQALGMSIISTAWGVGLVIGPALGGFLAQPAEKYPNIISKDSLFGRFPYFLPCLIISVFSLVGTIFIVL